MSMNYKEVSRGLPQEELERYSQGIALMGNIADVLQKQGLLPKRFAQVQQSQEVTTTQTDFYGKPMVFSEEEKKTLLADGAVIYLPTRETIKSQKAAKRPFRYIFNSQEVNDRDRLTDFPSRPIEVAIYPDPEKFFVPKL